MAIDMPMTVESVVIYLGIILAGCAACTVADSFAPPEIAARLRIAACKLVFTQACSGPSDFLLITLHPAGTLGKYVLIGPLHR